MQNSAMEVKNGGVRAAQTWQQRGRVGTAVWVQMAETLGRKRLGRDSTSEKNAEGQDRRGWCRNGAAAGPGLLVWNAGWTHPGGRQRRCRGSALLASEVQVASQLRGVVGQVSQRQLLGVHGAPQAGDGHLLACRQGADVLRRRAGRAARQVRVRWGGSLHRRASRPAGPSAWPGAAPPPGPSVAEHRSG